MRLKTMLRRVRLQAPFAALAMMMCASPFAFAASIHTWKDDNGVTHFSDSPPPDSVNTTVIEIADQYARASDKDDYYSIANQWARLKTERDESRARKLARDQLRAEERQRQAEIAAHQAALSDTDAYYPPVYRPHYPLVNSFGVSPSGARSYGLGRGLYGRGHGRSFGDINGRGFDKSRRKARPRMQNSPRAMPHASSNRSRGRGSRSRSHGSGLRVDLRF